MGSTRLSVVDASFLEVESGNAHMHVGWSAAFAPPPDGAPAFAEFRDHIERRLHRAPRYFQKLAEVPLGLDNPIWVDDPAFAIERHVVHAPGHDLGRIVETAMSAPLDRDRPLWKMWIADELDDGRIGLVGKAHHCMVDGLAAIELVSALLDAEPDPAPPDDRPDRPTVLRPAAAVSGLALVAGAVLDEARRRMTLSRLAVDLARSPRRLAEAPARAVETGRALVNFGRRAPVSVLNQPLSPLRHLASHRQPLSDLREIKARWGTSLNDVVLAATSGGIRRFMKRVDEEPEPLKAMVPVNVGTPGDHAEFGNHISFMWVDLPCDEPDPVRRLKRIHAETAKRKNAHEPEGTNLALTALGFAPRAVQQGVARLFASPRSSNVVVSNIPGPPQPVFMLGCELEEVFPIVPLSCGHTVSVGVMTIKDRACFGIYADRERLPDAKVLAEGIAESMEELLAASR